MKRIAHLAVIATLALGAQSAMAEEETTIQASPEPVAESAETYLNVAQMAPVMHNEAAAPQERSARKERNILKDLGLLMEDGFPQTGGPIDD
jgi:hypothetical protein